MIKDPVCFVPGSNHLELPEWTKGKTLFFITKWPKCEELGLMRVDTINRIRIFFSLGKGDNMCYIGRYASNKSDCLSFIAEKYPDHFMWLLFHPEWL